MHIMNQSYILYDDNQTISPWRCCSKEENDENMFDRRRIRCMFCLVFCIFISGIIYLGYFCPEKVCALSSNNVTPALPKTATPLSRKLPISGIQTSRKTLGMPCVDFSDQRGISEKFLKGSIMYQNFTYADLHKDYKFDIGEDRDVIVFLHMQKTGGTTFGRHLVRNVQLKKPCQCIRKRKHCDCENEHGHVWLFSRYSTGWKCGLHADFTELTSCVDVTLNKIESDIRHRRFLYITILRDPYYRYLSEYRHIRRGATWKSARLQCNGRQASLDEVPFCFEGDDWEGVSLQEFIDCPYNLANNRQTRMMANLSLSDCYGNSSLSPEQRDCIMLESAKENLRRMAFFGVTEFQIETQYMFERTFGLKFIEDFFQYTETHASELSVSTEKRQKILELNRLDMELYRYAKELFLRRLDVLHSEDGNWSGDNRRNIRSNPREDYEEEGEYDDDDDAYNHRITKGSKAKMPGNKWSDSLRPQSRWRA